MDNLIWVDIETGGLDPHHDKILEIAVVITDKDFNVICPAHYVIHRSENYLAGMSTWCKKVHTMNGLIDECINSRMRLTEVEGLLIHMIDEYAFNMPLCGNSVHFDRKFLEHYMPAFMHHVSYSNVDVSTLYELVGRWAPTKLSKVEKTSNHRALNDVVSSIDELKFYRKHCMKV